MADLTLSGTFRVHTMCSWAQQSDPTLSGTFQHGTRCSWAQQSDPIQSDTCLHCTSCSWPPQSVRLQSGTCQASTKSSCRPWSGLSHAGIRHSDAQRGCVLILKLHTLACLMHQYILAALCIVAYYLFLCFKAFLHATITSICLLHVSDLNEFRYTTNKIYPRYISMKKLQSW